MSAISSWVKKFRKEAPPEVTVEEIKSPPVLIEYPRAKYKAYWEIVQYQIPDGLRVEVRFYGYSDAPHIREMFVFNTPEYSVISGAIEDAIRTQMEVYKREAA